MAFKFKPRISIATMLLVVAIAALVCAIVARHLRERERKRAIEAYWHAHNAIISFDDDGHANWIIANTKPPAFEPRALTELNRTPNLDILVLQFTSVGDDDLKSLHMTPRLTMLALNKTAITDNAMTDIVKLNELKYLHIADTSVTDACIDAICRMHNLEALDVTNTKISPAGIERIQKELPGLRVIQ